MALPLTQIPTEFVAGDTFDVVLSSPDYAAPTYSAVLHLLSFGRTPISIGSTAYGSEFRFLLSGGSTGNWQPATYEWSIRVSDSGASVQITIATGRIVIHQNPAEATAQTDTRSHAKRTLDLLQAAIEGRLPNALDSYSVDGRTLNKVKFTELVQMRDRYAAIVASESGSGGRKNILFRFTRP